MAAKKVVKEHGIERDIVPMRIHKNVVAEFLREHPEDFREIVPESFTGTLDEYLVALEDAPGEWFVGGVLEGTAGE